MKYFLPIILFLFLADSARSATIVVTTAADTGAGSLRDAVGAASIGDTILFDAAINGMPIVLASEISINDKLYMFGNDSTNTIISGGDVTRIFIVDDTLHISGIRFQNGSYPGVNVVTGGAIGLTQNAVLYADECDFIDNEASFGGAIHCYQTAEAYIENSRFYRNTGLGTSTNGGSAICVTYGTASIVSLSKTKFEENIYLQENGNARAGALYCFGGNFVIDQCEFVNNKTTALTNSYVAQGGAIHCRGFSTYTYSLSITDSQFDGNSAESSDAGARGGTISADGIGTASMLRSTITNSSLVSVNGVAAGGAFYFNGDSLALIDCYFDNNIVVSSAGPYTGTGGALYMQDGEPEIVRCTFSNNAVFSGDQYAQGGAVAVTAGIDTMRVTNCTFYGNGTIGGTGSYGGAIYDNAITSFYTNNTIYLNSCSGGTQSSGGGLGLYRSYSYRELRNNIISDNTTTNNYADMYWETTSTYTLDNNLIRNIAPTSLPITYTTDPGLDPAGVQMNGGLTPTIAVVNPASDVVDNASAFAPMFDQRGAIRNGNPDLGAYEFNGCVETSASIVESVCESYTSPGGMVYTSSGIYVDTITNALGCDSVVTIDLTVNFPSAAAIQITVCDSYTTPSGNDTYTVSGMYMDTIPNAAGCDSVLTIDLTVNQSNTGNDIVTACDSYTWIDGNTYTSSNSTATHILTNSLGCDSLVTLNLTINYSNTGTEVVTACDSYSWIDGNTYTASNNTATFTLTNVSGCDSVVTLDLTIINSTSATDVISACATYTWIDGNTYTSSNNSATFTLTNSVGCDSLVTLDLTILSPTSSTDVVSACDSYTWLDGNTYTASNNSATYTTTNSVGCDSVITLDLAINYSNTGTDVVTACDSYTWIDGNTYTASNNTAMYTLTNSAGCDSVITLDLTINYSNTGTDVVSACDSYTWIDGNTYTTSNNTATHTLTNSAGCDSLITLDLTIVSTVAGIAQVDDVTLESTNSGADYIWIDCVTGLAIPGETAQTFEATVNGEYAVVVTENNCSDTSDCMVIDQVRLDEVPMYALRVYPNPNNGQFTVDFGQKMNGDLLLRAMDGRLVSMQQMTDKKEAMIDVRGVESGVYILELFTEQGLITQRITIQN